MAVIPIAILVAYLLDIIIGDPRVPWHPVRIIGSLIERLETVLNNAKVNKKLTGLLLVALVTGATVFSVLGILKFSRAVHPALYFIAYVLLVYFALAVKSLAQEAGNVRRALLSGDIFQARKKLSMIVARDTQHLDEPQVIRATVETVAESTMDGIISPLFYAFLGGPVLAWAYKAVNTLDSMVGYKNERFADFGWAAAKIDAALNFIPAKITCFAILGAGFCCKRIKASSWRCLTKYFFKGQQYNSESTEAAMASLLGVQLGGLNYYGCVPLQKNLIGEKLYPLEIKRISESVKIAYIASGLSVATGIFLIYLLGRR